MGIEISGKGKWVITSIIFCVLIISVFLSLAKPQDHGLIDLPAEQEEELEQNGASEADDTEINQPTTGLIKGPGYRKTRNPGGTLEWHYVAGGHISTPALSDLTGNGRLEIIFATDNDQVICLNNAGEYQWSYPMVIDGSEAGPMCDFQPPKFFSSVTVGDLDIDGTKEILVGGMNELHCITPTGAQKWVHTGANYYATPAVGDINDDGYLEVVAASDKPGGFANNYAYVEGIWYNGLSMWTHGFVNGEPPFVISSPCLADIDGENETERFMETSVGQHDYLFNILDVNGNMVFQEGGMSAHESYVSHCMANITGDKRLEIISGTGESVSGKFGNVQCINQDGTVLWTCGSDYGGGGDPAEGPTRLVASAPALGDVDASGVFDVIFGSDNGYLYRVNADDGEVMWYHQTGGKIQSAPALFDIDTDKLLEYVVGSDDGNVYAFDCDGNLLWSYSIGAPIGIASAVVSDIDYDNQLEVIIGAENGNLYCLSAGGNSTLGQTDWPTFHHGNNNTGLYNTTFKHSIDLIPTNKDDPGWSEGITPKHNPSHRMVQYVDVGDATDFYFQAWNLGAHNDTIDLAITNEIPENWTATLDMNDTGVVDPGSYKLVKMHVQSPDSAKPGETAYIQIEGRSRLDDSLYEKLHTYTIVNLTIDFDFEIVGGEDVTIEPDGSKLTHIRAGFVKLINAKLVNKGSLNDTYNVVIEDGSSTWESYFEDGTTQTNFTLPNKKYHINERTKNFAFYVKAPNNALKGEEITVRLTASSDKHFQIFEYPLEKFDEITIRVTSNSSLVLNAEKLQESVAPGEAATYGLTAKNNGNNVLYVDAEYHGNAFEGIQPSDYDWMAHLEPVSFTLNPGQIQSMTFDVFAPRMSLAGEKVTIYITAKAPIPEGGNIESNALVFITTVKRVSEINASVGTGEGECYPGESVNFTVDIENGGNGEDEVEFKMEEGEIDWSYDFYVEQDVKVNKMTLDQFEEVEIRLQVGTTTTTPAGNYSLVINISGVLVPIKINIKQIHDISLECADNSDTADPGTSMAFKILATNRGNGKDVAVLNVDTVLNKKGTKRMDWTLYFTSVANSPHPELDESIETNIVDLSGYKSKVKITLLGENVQELRVTLDRGEIAYIDVFVLVPFDETAAIFNTDVLAEPAAGLDKDVRPGDNQVTLYFEIMLSDLAIHNLVVPDDLSEGDLITIRVEVTNKGDITANNIRISVYIDGSKIGDTDIVTIIKDDVKVATFTWRAEGAGVREVKAVVDPQNTIRESSGDPRNAKEGYKKADQREGSNNIAVEKMNVKGGILGGFMSVEMFTYFFLPLIILIAVVVGTILYMKRRGSKKPHHSSLEKAVEEQKKQKMKEKPIEGEGGESGTEAKEGASPPEGKK